MGDVPHEPGAALVPPPGTSISSPPSPHHCHTPNLPSNHNSPSPPLFFLLFIHPTPFPGTLNSGDQPTSPATRTGLEVALGGHDSPSSHPWPPHSLFLTPPRCNDGFNDVRAAAWLFFSGWGTGDARGGPCRGRGFVPALVWPPGAGLGWSPWTGEATPRVQFGPLPPRRTPRGWGTAEEQLFPCPLCPPVSPIPGEAELVVAVAHPCVAALAHADLVVGTLGTAGRLGTARGRTAEPRGGGVTRRLGTV